jgi:hypothetical protein
VCRPEQLQSSVTQPGEHNLSPPPFTTRCRSFCRQRLWPVFVLWLWAGWWGGLTFYALAVVPIGTELLGSVEQGFVTQQVTRWHNLLSVAFAVALFAEARRRRSRFLVAGAFGLLLVALAAIGWHIRLTALMDFKHHAVPATFYREHAVYLWLTAAEWGFGLVVPVWLFTTGTSPDPPPHTAPDLPSADAQTQSPPHADRAAGR